MVECRKGKGSSEAFGISRNAKAAHSPQSGHSGLIVAYLHCYQWVRANLVAFAGWAGRTLTPIGVCKLLILWQGRIIDIMSTLTLFGALSL